MKTQVKERTQTKTIAEVIADLREWNEVHNPYDRSSRLNHWQFVTQDSADKDTEAVLVPLANKLEVNPNSDLMILQPHALGQYLNRLDYPQRFYKRVPDKLNILNLNWLVQNAGYDKDVLLRVQDDNRVRAVMSNVFEPFDALEVMEIAEPYLHGGIVRWYYDDQLTFHLSVSWSNQAEEIAKGDIVERGVHISDSPVGLRRVFIAGYTHRLICKNGAIAKDSGDSFSFRHVGDHDRMRGNVVKALESAKLETERILVQFKNAVNIKIDEPFVYLENLTKERDLTQEQFKAMMNSLVGEPQKGNLFGISQSISAAAQQFDGEQAFDMQRLSVDVTNRAN